MRARPSHLIFVCLLAVLLFAAAGCGSDDDNGSASETTTTGTTATTSTGTTATTDEGTTTTGTDEGEGTTDTDEDEGTTTTGNEDTGTTSDENEDEGGSRGADIDSVVLRTRRNRVVCGTDEQNDRTFLVCFQPATGATVRLGPSAVPKSSLVEDNKGVPPGTSGAPVMGKGDVITSGDYRCTFQRGAVRCINPAGHGFLIGGVSIFRF